MMECKTITAGIEEIITIRSLRRVLHAEGREGTSTRMEGQLFIPSLLLIVSRWYDNTAILRAGSCRSFGDCLTRGWDMVLVMNLRRNE